MSLSPKAFILGKDTFVLSQTKQDSREYPICKTWLVVQLVQMKLTGKSNKSRATPLSFREYLQCPILAKVPFSLPLLRPILLLCILRQCLAMQASLILLPQSHIYLRL